MSTSTVHATEAGDIALLANGEPAPATDSPAATGTESPATPSLPEPVVVPASGADTSMENIHSAMLYAGTEINTEREIAEEQARRPQVVIPAAGAFTSGYGMRWGSFHAGIDIANAVGTPIYSVMSGTVINSGPASGYGQWIRVQHDDGSMAVYGHMSALYVSAGERVSAGQTIAGMGSEGFSTGSHLHFEIHPAGMGPVDPVGWFANHGVYF